jgi:hypothetical protein
LNKRVPPQGVEHRAQISSTERKACALLHLQKQLVLCHPQLRSKRMKPGCGQQSQTGPSSTPGLFMCSNQPRTPPGRAGGSGSAVAKRKTETETTDHPAGPAACSQLSASLKQEGGRSTRNSESTPRKEEEAQRSARRKARGPVPGHRAPVRVCGLRFTFILFPPASSSPRHGTRRRRPSRFFLFSLTPTSILSLSSPTALPSPIIGSWKCWARYLIGRQGGRH